MAVEGRKVHRIRHPTQGRNGSFLGEVVAVRRDIAVVREIAREDNPETYPQGVSSSVQDRRYVCRDCAPRLFLHRPGLSFVNRSGLLPRQPLLPYATRILSDERRTYHKTVVVYDVALGYLTVCLEFFAKINGFRLRVQVADKQLHHLALTGSHRT